MRPSGSKSVFPFFEQPDLGRRSVKRQIVAPTINGLWKVGFLPRIEDEHEMSRLFDFIVVSLVARVDHLGRRFEIWAVAE